MFKFVKQKLTQKYQGELQCTTHLYPNKTVCLVDIGETGNFNLSVTINPDLYEDICI